MDERSQYCPIMDLGYETPRCVVDVEDVGAFILGVFLLCAQDLLVLGSLRRIR
jgi:hypothetical protein